jgi:arylsulfatase
MAGRTSLTLADGMTGMSENVFINVKNKSKTITAELNIPEGGANGVVLAQGGRFGGWCLYLKDGKPTYTYNYLNQNQYTISSAEALPKGKNKLMFEFTYDGGGLGKGGTGSLSVDGRKLADGRIDKTQPIAFSADETADVGIDDATPVVAGIGQGAQTRFTGKIEKITIDVK